MQSSSFSVIDVHSGDHGISDVIKIQYCRVVYSHRRITKREYPVN